MTFGILTLGLGWGSPGSRTGITSPLSFMDHFYTPYTLSTLKQLSNGTTDVTATGDRVGYAADQVGTAHAIQATAGNRSYLAKTPSGGRRNVLRTTDAPTSGTGSWQSTGGTLTNAFLTMDSSPGTRCERTGATGSLGPITTLDTAAWAPDPAAGEQWMMSCLVRTNTGTKTVRFRLQETGGVAGDRTVETDLSLTTTPQYLELPITVAEADRTGLTVRYGVTLDTSAHDIIIAKFMLEKSATRGAYQAVTNQYNVTEAGANHRYSLYKDAAGQLLTATLPNLGTSATRAYSSNGVVTITGGLTINGATQFPDVERLEWIGYINRPLTSAEEAFLNGWAPNFT